MPTLHLALIQPQIPQNTGNIARTCAATGAVLHLVSPLGFSLDNAQLKRAGLDYWNLLDIRRHASLAAFLESPPGPLYFFSTKAPRRHTDVAYPDNACLVFGREDQGLPEDLLYANPERTLRIPMLAEARSLNLSNAVAIACYEALRQWDYPSLSGEGRLRNYRWQVEKP